MKKFRFALRTVQNYKESLLENLRLEHAAILAEIARQEQVIAALEREKDLIREELNERNAQGISPFELVNYQRYMRVLQTDIDKKYALLEKTKKAEEAKREELIEMKKETASLEKLKEKKLEEYHHMANKAQEQFIEEFVSYSKYAEQ